jgi:hypothetical protein
MNIQSIKDALAIEMMKGGGWDPDHPEEHPIEWDLTRPDSQYSMAVDQASKVTDFILQQIMNMSDESDDELEDEEEESFLDEYGHIRRNQTNTTSASLFIFMDAGTGNPRYVSDVRKWLENVDKAGIPDDTEIEGQLYLDYDLKGVIETIQCGECGASDMLISTCGH